RPRRPGGKRARKFIESLGQNGSDGGRRRRGRGGALRGPDALPALAVRERRLPLGGPPPDGRPLRPRGRGAGRLAPDDHLRGGGRPRCRLPGGGAGARPSSPLGPPPPALRPGRAGGGLPAPVPRPAGGRARPALELLAAAWRAPATVPAAASGAGAQVGPVLF